VPRRSGLLVLGAILLCTAGVGLAMGIFFYVQLREAETAGARVAARNAQLEQSAQALDAKVQTLEHREEGLSQLLDELGSKQRVHEAAMAERAATLDALGAVLQPLLKRGDAFLREEPDALEVHLAERALFAVGTSRISPSGVRLLRQLGDGLTDTHWRVEVTGRGPSLLTGSLEEGAARARFAAERAARVSSFLVRRIGLADERVSASVYGPVRRRPGEPAAVRRSCIALRLLAPLADFDRQTAAAFAAPPSIARP
jgi:flagellar motor protein MotB